MILAGWTPQLSMPLSPELARQLADWRERVNADVDIILVEPDRAIGLVAPHDGGDLFVLAFDALTFAGDDGEPQ